MGFRRNLETMLLLAGGVTLVTAGFGQRRLRFFVEHVTQAFVKQEREDELLVVAGINRPAQERGCAPEIGFKLLLGDAGHLRSYAPTVHTRKSQRRFG